MTYNVNGFYTTKKGKEIEFDRDFKSEQASLNYFTKIRDNTEWETLALNWEDQKELLATELGRDGRLI